MMFKMLRSNLCSIRCPFGMLVIVFAWCLVSCQDDDVIGENDINEPDSITAGTALVSIAAGKLIDDNDYWVVVHDQDGRVLDYRQFSSNDNFTLFAKNSLLGDHIGVSFITTGLQARGPASVIQTSLDISPGKTFTMGGVPAAGDVGSFDILYAPGDSGYDRIFVTSGQGRTPGGGSLIRPTYTLAYRLYNNTVGTDHIVVITDNAGNSKFKKLFDVQANQTITLSASDFENFDQLVEFTFPSPADFSYSVSATNGKGTYVLNEFDFHSSHLEAPRSKAKVSYLNDMAAYDTDLNLRYSDYSLEYTANNMIPSGNVKWPSRNDFQLESTSKSDFRSTAKVPFQYRQSEWAYIKFHEKVDTIAYWGITTRHDDHGKIELPNEVVAKYPHLLLDKLEHESTRFYVTSPDYEDLLPGLPLLNKPYERTAIYLTNQ